MKTRTTTSGIFWRSANVVILLALLGHGCGGEDAPASGSGGGCDELTGTGSPSGSYYDGADYSYDASEWSDEVLLEGEHVVEAGEHLFSEIDLGPTLTWRVTYYTVHGSFTVTEGGPIRFFVLSERQYAAYVDGADYTSLHELTSDQWSSNRWWSTWTLSRSRQNEPNRKSSDPVIYYVVLDNTGGQRRKVLGADIRLSRWE